MISKIKEYSFIFIGILIIFIIFSIILFIVKIFLGFSEEKFKETIIAGFFQSILSGAVLYFIFNELLLKRPKVRLYIEPAEITLNQNGEFALKFYINNSGDLIAKDILLMIFFNDLEIVRGSSNFRRIDELQGGIPSVQFNNSKPIYPVKNRNNYIGELTFKLKVNKEKIYIVYNVVADNMSIFESTYPIKIIKI